MRKSAYIICVIIVLNICSMIVGSAEAENLHPNLVIIEETTGSPFWSDANYRNLHKIEGILEQYDDMQLGYMPNSIIAVRKDGKWGILGIDGQVIAEPQYKSVLINAETMVQTTDDKYGFLDEIGNIIVEPKYDTAENFDQNGYAVVGRDFRYTVIDKTGKELVPLIPHRICISSDGKFFSYEQDGKTYIVDNAGMSVTTIDFVNAYIYNIDGTHLIGFEKEGKQGACGFDSKIIFEPEYDFIWYDEARDIFCAEKSGRTLYMHLDGTLIGGRDWEQIPHYLGSENTLLLIKDGGKYGYMDVNGNVLMPPIFEETLGMVIKLKGRTGIVGGDGRYIAEPKWNIAPTAFSARHTDGYYIFQIDAASGLLDSHGNVILEPIFDYILTYDGIEWIIGKDSRTYIAKLAENPTAMSDALLKIGIETLEADYLVEKGIISGDEEGNLNLYNSATRAEFAAMAARMENWDCAEFTSVFADTNVHWASGYIAKAVSEGLIKGFDDGTFKPDESITVEHVYIIMLRKLGIAEETIASTEPVTLATIAGIAPSGAYIPAEDADREFIAKVLYNYMHTNMTPEKVYGVLPVVDEFN